MFLIRLAWFVDHSQPVQRNIQIKSRWYVYTDDSTLKEEDEV